MQIKRFLLFFCIIFIFSSFYIRPINHSKTILGYSLSQRPIDLYKFGKSKNVIIIIAGIHGNEPNTVETANLIINGLIDNKIKMVDNKSIWIIPNLNPDGFARERRFNDNDVDLNRNFDTENWQPSFYLFNILLSAGKNPFSEPETMTLKSLFESLDLNKTKPVVISLHSKGDAIIPGSNSTGNNIFALYIKNNSSYKYENLGYNTSGDMNNWLSNKIGIISSTIELKTKNQHEYNEIINIINALFKIDFEKYFYNYELTLSLQNEIEKENTEFLLKNLPEVVIKNTTFSQGDVKKFYEIYNYLSSKEELLILVNKSNYINSNYAPDDLVEISKIFPTKKKPMHLRKMMIPDLKQMFDEAKKDNITLSIVSAYRSYETQKTTYEYWKSIYGEEEASRISAKPGASQHQLGTTIDFNMLQLSFENAKPGKWLAKNAYKFGFIISYPKGQENLTGYEYEPWHYRYIGKEAAFLVYNYFNNQLELFLNWFWNKQIEK